MGVSVEGNEGTLGGEVGLGLRDFVDVVKLRRLVERGMGEGDGIQIRSDREIPQPAQLVLAYLFLGNLKGLADGYLPVLLEDLVGEQEHRLVVAQNTDRTEVHDPPDALSRLGSVADDVPEAKGPPNGEVPDVRKNGLQRIEVGMDVTDDGKEVGLCGGGGFLGVCGVFGFGHDGLSWSGCERGRF